MKLKLYSWVFLFIVFNFHLNAQHSDYSHFKYISPVPNSRYVSPLSNIIIRTVDNIDRFDLSDKNIIKVTGTISGLHRGELILLDDNKTLIFNLGSPFTEGEIITVVFDGNKIGTSENKMTDLSFSFTISESWTKNITYSTSINLENDLKFSNIFESERESAENRIPDFSNKIDLLPPDFPEYYISIFNNPSDGYIFVSPFPWPAFVPGFLIIMDNYGVPIFYRRYSPRCMDFKLNRNGLLTYFNRNRGFFFELDSAYATVDSFACGNGYTTDVHDLQVLPNGNSFLMSYDNQTVRMDTIVPGGDPSATVIGLIIQELDENKNVVFQWRSWDHFKITDATDDIDLTAHTIDYVHGNSVELDDDGNLIISCRHMDEITKINRNSGEIMWRLGGENNQFQFVDDPRGFSHQHDARRASNGNLTLFDNGNLLSPQYSSSLEYQLNETDKIATLVWNHPDTSVYSDAMGSSQRLDNDRTIIGWGNTFNPAVTEVNNDNTITFELFFNSAFTYRAFRFPWRTNLLTADNYRVDFEYVPVNTSDTKEIVITNNSNEQLEVTSFYSRSSIFSVIDKFPIPLQPHQNKVLQIQFFPDSIGIFSDDIHLQVQKENEMISQVIKVLGFSDPLVDVETEKNHPPKYKLLQNYPNPFNPITTIYFQIPELSIVKLTVYDVLGKEVATLINAEKSAGSHEIEFVASRLPSGIYFYKLQAGNFVESKKMVLLK